MHAQFLKTADCKDLFIELISREEKIHFTCGVVNRHPNCNFKSFVDNLEANLLQPKFFLSLKRF